MEKVVKLLEKRLPQVNDIVPDINCGGCGCFALELGKILEEFNPEYWIFTYDFSINNYKKGIESVLSCRHVLVKVFDRFIDSDGTYTDPEDSSNRIHEGYPFIQVSREELERFVADRGIWNDWYKRRYNKEIRKFLTIFKQELYAKLEKI